MRDAAALLLCGLVCGACARQAPAPPAALSAGADPAEIFASVLRQEEQIHTLRARFSAEFASHTAVRRAGGVLLVKKPDCFRLRLLSPFGLTVFDYTSCGKHARIELPLEGKHIDDAESEAGTQFPLALLRRQFLRTAAETSERCTPEAREAAVVVSCRDAAGAVQHEFDIDRHTATLSREVSHDAQTQYEDYRPVGGLRLPFAITVVSEPYVLHVTVAGYEVNPTLQDALFDPPGAAEPGR